MFSSCCQVRLPAQWWRMQTPPQARTAGRPGDERMICSYRSTLRMLTVLYVSMASTLTLKCLSFASRPTRSAASWAVPVWLPYSTSSRLLSAEDITTSSAAAARLVKGRHRLVLSQHLLFCWLIQQYGRVLW